MPSAGELILQNSTNEIDNPKYITRSDKEWAHEYAGIENILLHTTPGYGGNTVHATFDSAFLPLDDDEERRMTEPANPPNERSWRLETEADVEHWWHTEVSDVVLAAWARYPGIVQTCHTKPLSDVNIPENVDATYAIYIGNQRKPVVIGEMKRNLINRREWEAGNVTSSQQKLARELRGYADSPWDIRRADCAVDCWVIPITKSTCSLRYALYRLLVQGFRRCQAAAAARPIQADG